MAQQTAVNFLYEFVQMQLTNEQQIQYEGLFKQAERMEKEQIVKAFGVGCQVESTRLIGYHGMAEQYYNETYKQ